MAIIQSARKRVDGSIAAAALAGSHVARIPRSTFMSANGPIRIARVFVVLWFCGTSVTFSAELVTDEAIRLQILRTEFPRATVSTARNGETPPKASLDPQLQPLAYTDSGRLLPLTADGAGSNFLHISAHSPSRSLGGRSGMGSIDENHATLMVGL